MPYPLTQHEVPTLGSLEYQILMDQRLSSWERELVLGNLRAEVGPVSKDTPLRDLAGRIGGGVLGWLVSKYFGMGVLGQSISALAGYGIGTQMRNFYTAMNQAASGDRSSMVTPWGSQ
jgi:hypothetical protein